MVIMDSSWYGQLNQGLLGNRKKRGPEYFATTGIDEMIRLSKAGELVDEKIYHCVTQLNEENNAFNLVTQTTKPNEKLFQLDLYETAENIISELDGLYDVTFVDTQCDQDKINHVILSQMDMILVFLPQNQAVIEAYKNNPLPYKNIYFILVRYESKSTMNIFNLKCQYSFIRKKLLGVIPYHVSYMDVCSQGKIFKFFQINQDGDAEDSNGKFIKELWHIIHFLTKEEGKFVNESIGNQQ